jgi:hypothetical protein
MSRQRIKRGRNHNLLRIGSDLARSNPAMILLE